MQLSFQNLEKFSGKLKETWMIIEGNLRKIWVGTVGNPEENVTFWRENQTTLRKFEKNWIEFVKNLTNFVGNSKVKLNSIQKKLEQCLKKMKEIWENWNLKIILGVSKVTIP